jgi:hypothetical protein
MRRMSQKNRNRTHLGVEALEERWCPSTTVVFDNNTDTLTITGDAAANKVTLRQDDVANQLHVLHDGIDETFSSSAVSKVVVDLKAGNDSFTHTLQEGTNLSYPRTLQISTGAGADKVMFDYAGNINHWTIAKQDTEIALRTGGGADTVKINVPTVEIANLLRLQALLGAGDDVFEAIGYGDVGADGFLNLDIRGKAGNDVLTYHGAYDALGAQFGLKVGDQAGLSVLFDGGAGLDKIKATYLGEVDGLCSFYLHGDLQKAGGQDRDRVSARLTAQPDSVGSLYGYTLGGRGQDALKLIVETDMPLAGVLSADGGNGVDTCISTANVTVANCETTQIKS